MELYIGCSGFYNKDWKNVFYPEGLTQSKWFEYYCTRFNTLELNTTFYRFPRVATLQKWYDKSPVDFKFSVKAPRLISHYKQFNDCTRLLSDFYASVEEGLKEKLGSVLFQLPARVVYNESVLDRIIEGVDNNFLNTVEFRHPSWWNEFVYSQLAKNKIIFCGASIQQLPNEIISNTNAIYYRFHGLKKLYFSQYPKKEMKMFADEMKQQAVNKAFIYFNNTATIAAINNAFQLTGFLK